jgi:hypothetical protein
VHVDEPVEHTQVHGRERSKSWDIAPKRAASDSDENVMTNATHLALSRTFQMGSWCMSTRLSTHTHMRRSIVEHRLLAQILAHPAAGSTLQTPCLNSLIGCLGSLQCGGL